MTQPLRARFALVLSFLADAVWLNETRARAWVLVLGVVSGLLAIGWVVASLRGVDPSGSPLGNDFLGFWTAGRLIAQGAAATAPYDQDVHHALQQATFPAAQLGYTPFPYPPTFLLICVPLAVLPYFASLVTWLALTAYSYWRAVRAWIGAPGFTLAILAFPAVAMNAGAGQTGFLTTALFGAGGYFLLRRPWLAGAFLGALSFKPQVGLLIPVALLAARNWRAFLGAAASASLLAATAILIFGPSAWLGFLAQAPMMKAVVEGGLVDPGKLVTTFAALRLIGAPVWAAYASQGLVALMAAGIVVAMGVRQPTNPALPPVLVAACLLPSPYLVFYDLTLVALPLAWLLSEGSRTGFLRWEKTAMLAAFVLPLVSNDLALRFHIPMAPPVLLALLATCVRRAWRTDAVTHKDGPLHAKPSQEEV